MAAVDVAFAAAMLIVLCPHSAFASESCYTVFKAGQFESHAVVLFAVQGLFP